MALGPPGDQAAVVRVELRGRLLRTGLGGAVYRATSGPVRWLLLVVVALFTDELKAGLAPLARRVLRLLRLPTAAPTRPDRS